MILYHYTSKDSIDNILASKSFFPSSFDTSLDDAVYGTGWYFTDLSPDNHDNTLFRKLWNKIVPHRVKNYIVFDIDSSLVVKCRENVYKLDYSLIQNGVLNISLTYNRSQFDNTIVIKYVRTGTRYSPPSNPNSTVDVGTMLGGALVVVGVVAILGALFGGK